MKVDLLGLVEIAVKHTHRKQIVPDCTGLCLIPLLGHRSTLIMVAFVTGHWAVYVFHPAAHALSRGIPMYAPTCYMCCSAISDASRCWPARHILGQLKTPEQRQEMM